MPDQYTIKATGQRGKERVILNGEISVDKTGSNSCEVLIATLTEFRFKHDLGSFPKITATIIKKKP